LGANFFKQEEEEMNDTKIYYEALIADLDGCLDLVRLQWMNAAKPDKAAIMNRINSILDQRFSLMRKRDA